jgi:hypothetical protein
MARTVDEITERMSLNPKHEKSGRELSEVALRKIDSERVFQQDALNL